MQIARVFSGEDNESHFEELTADQLTELITSRVGDGPITVYRREAQSVSDFHNAPRLQYVVMLAGEIEFETGDGSKRKWALATCWWLRMLRATVTSHEV